MILSLLDRDVREWRATSETRSWKSFSMAEGGGENGGGTGGRTVAVCEERRVGSAVSIVALRLLGGRLGSVVLSFVRSHLA